MLKITVRKRSVIQKDTRVVLFNIFIFTFDFSKCILSGRIIFDNFYMQERKLPRKRGCQLRKSYPSYTMQWEYVLNLKKLLLYYCTIFINISLIEQLDLRHSDGLDTKRSTLYKHTQRRWILIILLMYKYLT